METETQKPHALPLSNGTSQEDFQSSSVFNSQILNESVQQESEVASNVKPVLYRNLEKHKQLMKTGLVKEIKNQQTHTKILSEQYQQDFSSVLLPNFGATTANLFKKQLFNKTTKQVPIATVQDKKGIRHHRNLSPLQSNNVTNFMQQSQRTNLMWTTTKYSANNTHKSLKTNEIDENTSLGIFPSKMRSQSIKPTPIRLLNDQSKEITMQMPFQLKLSQTQTNKFFKPKASIERYQAVFVKSHLHGFEIQRGIQPKNEIEVILVPDPVKVDPLLVPELLRNTTIAGSPPKPGLTPACFCYRDEICINHTEYQPKIDTMLDLIDNQIETLLSDDIALGNNLEMISKTSNTLMTSRQDTFKETLMEEYRSREEDINILELRVAKMSLQEHQHEKITKERDEYAEKLEKALTQMDQFSKEVLARAHMSKIEVQELTQRQLSVQVELQNLRQQLQRVTLESKIKGIQLDKGSKQLKQQEELLIELNTENARIARENETFRKYYVLNNAMLVTNKDDPAYIRQQVQEMYKDFGKAVSNSGAFIHQGFDSIEKLINDNLISKNQDLVNKLMDK